MASKPSFLRRPIPTSACDVLLGSFGRTYTCAGNWTGFVLVWLGYLVINWYTGDWSHRVAGLLHYSFAAMLVVLVLVQYRDVQWACVGRIGRRGIQSSSNEEVRSRFHSARIKNRYLMVFR